MSDKKIIVRVQGQDEDIFYHEPDRERIKMYYEYCEDNFRKGKDYNLVFEAFEEVKSVKVVDDGAILSVQGREIRNTQIDCDGELRPIICRDTENDVLFDCFIKITLIGSKTFRVTAGKGNEVLEHNTVMLEDVVMPKASKFTTKDTVDNFYIYTDDCTLCVEKKLLNIKILNKFDKTIYEQANDDKVLYFTHESFPFGYVKNPHTDERIISISSRMDADEHYFGFGEQYSKVDKQGQEVDIFITDPLSCGSARTYLSLPFYWSTKGYGLYVNTHFRSKFFMGNRSNRATGCHVYSDEVIDFFLFYGENPKEILNSYTDVTGKSPMLPKWSFGLWMSRCSYKTDPEVRDIAKTLREHDIPCDVINIDTDWFEFPWACDWKFGKHNFPEPAKMLKDLADDGFKVSVWQKPYISAARLPELTNFMIEKGWVPVNKYNELARSNPVIDLSNPECYEWYKDRIRELFDLGVKVIKTDMGEGVPIEADYHKYSGEEIRNIYAYLYNKAAYEVTVEKEGEEDSLVWGRSGYAGSQKFPLHWAGDPFVSFDGLRYSIRSGLSMGMSGFTFWSHDIGGFLGRPTPECYIRWTQAGMFCSHSRCHGAGNPREPWTFGEEAEKIFRDYDKLRYKLLPYIYSQSKQLIKDGMPMMQHLILQYPNDFACAYIEDAWMFGDSFLVAPILDETNSRKVYLPEGEWYDFHTNAISAGEKWYSVYAPLEILPLYVKAGAIIPMAPVVDYITTKEDSALNIKVYHKNCGESQFIYYNGEEHCIKAVFSADGVVVNTPKLNCPISIELISSKGCKTVEVTGNTTVISC